MSAKHSYYAILICLLLTLSLIGSVPQAIAQGYSDKPVTVVVPFTPKSATDALGRIMSQKLSELLGQQVVVKNHPGAGGMLGADAVAKSGSGGHTLLVSAAFIVSPAIYAKLPYDPDKDFAHIAPLASQALVLVVGSKAKEKSVSDVIEAAKARPGQVKYASPGVGSGAHLGAEKFKMAAGIEVVHVPFKGGPGTIRATAEGEVTYAFLPIAAAAKGIKAGKIRALGVSSTERSSLLPDVPTIAEAGVPGFEATLWWGVWTDAGISSGDADKLAKDINRAMAAPDVLKKLTKRGFKPMKMSRKEFGRFVQSEMKAVARTVKEAGIQKK